MGKQTGVTLHVTKLIFGSRMWRGGTLALPMGEISIEIILIRYLQILSQRTLNL